MGEYDLPELESIARLTLAADDVLVIRLRAQVPAFHMQRLGESVRDALPLHNRVLILDHGASIDVLTAAQIAALADTG